jgi:REP element-mobilizing transposase RayT
MLIQVTPAHPSDREPVRLARPTGWGGPRTGAGRKPTGRLGRDRLGRPRAGVSHRPRGKVYTEAPLHVTVRTVFSAPSLRRRGVGDAIGEVLKRRARRALRCRVVHFTILADHLHLIVEAADAVALARGMQGLLSGLARVINRATGCSGKLWRDRYHARPLLGARAIRTSLVYVLRNARKHQLASRPIDIYSSAAWFDGFAGHGPPRRDAAPVHRAVGWLLRDGWRLAGGPIRPSEAPA